MANVAAELDRIYRDNGGLRPDVVVDWARKHPGSVLHNRFQWDNSKAAHAYRLWQARELITEVVVEYPDGKIRQVYVSPVYSRKNAGYQALIHVLNDEEKRLTFLAQALEEYQRASEKYADLKELADVRRSVKAAVRKYGSRPRKAA